jgi:hypothetical protein
MSLKHLVIALTVLGVFAMAVQFSVDTDTWWHLRAGQWILDNHQIPREDHFSHTRQGSAWEYPGWLMELLMIGIYKVFGLGGLNVMTAVFVTLTWMLLWVIIEGNVYFKAFLVILAAAVSGVYWAARPYILTFFLAGCYLFILERERKLSKRLQEAERKAKRSLLWLLPVLMIVWANSHGGFAVGLIIYGIYGVGLAVETGLYKQLSKVFALIGKILSKTGSGFQPAFTQIMLREERPRLKKFWLRFSLVGLMIVLAVCVNPHGPKMLLYPFQTVSIEALNQYIQEWQPPDFHDVRFLPFLILLLLSYLVLGASGKRASFLDLLAFIIFGYLALRAGRNIPFFALTAPILISKQAVSAWDLLGKEANWLSGSRTRGPTRTQRILHIVLLAAALTAVGLKTFFYTRPGHNREYLEGFLPVRAALYLHQEGPSGKIFNDYNWGGYLMWALPEYPVYIDGRTDLYGDQLIQDWLTVVKALPGWEIILESQNIQVVLVPKNYPIAEILPEKDWQAIYEDDLSVVFYR